MASHIGFNKKVGKSEKIFAGWVALLLSIFIRDCLNIYASQSKNPRRFPIFK